MNYRAKYGPLDDDQLHNVLNAPPGRYSLEETEAVRAILTEREQRAAAPLPPLHEPAPTTTAATGLPSTLRNRYDTLLRTYMTGGRDGQKHTVDQYMKLTEELRNQRYLLPVETDADRLTAVTRLNADVAEKYSKQGNRQIIFGVILLILGIVRVAMGSFGWISIVLAVVLFVTGSQASSKASAFSEYAARRV